LDKYDNLVNTNLLVKFNKPGEEKKEENLKQNQEKKL
jgi:hypothetical protein